MFKNTASQKVIVYAFDSTTNQPKTGDAANLTAYVSKDYAAVTVLGDTSATEMDATNAKGYYLFDLTQAETNADTLLFSGKSATSNIVVLAMPATVFTVPANFTKLVIDASGLADANTVKLGPTGAGTAQTARDLGANIDAAVSSRMATYTQPTGFLAATFPAGTVANTTNITAGTVTTATNLTNAPTAGDFTAVMKTSIGTAVAASAVASVTAGVTVTTNNDKTGYSVASGGIGSGAHAAAELNAIADALLDRNMATGADNGTDSTVVRTVRQALRRLRNKEAIAAGTGTVTKEDDSTASWTYAATTTAGNPISSVDPT